MDLSINKVNLNKNLNFKGLEGAYNAKSEPVYRFYAPAHSSSEQVCLEFIPLYKDEKTAQFKKPSAVSKTYTVKFNGDSPIDITQQQAKEMSGDGFGYRFKIVDKKTGKHIRYDNDSFKAINKDASNKINVITHGNFYGISPKGGTMRHSFLDSDARIGADGKLIKPAQTQEVRNHFNKFDGSIKGLNQLLLENNSELEPYGYFMTTPDIGVDKISSHRYWPANHYQCSDLDTFKDFNFNLFKKGKGYVADGAFTSQGIQSPLVQHVLKWGKESPFYDWLKIDDYLALGVLPDYNGIDGVNPYDHIGVRLVNGKGEGYDKTKPTYIQFYDDRLLSKAKVESGKLEFAYDIAPDDVYEITTHQDSVQPYAFEVSPDDKRLKEFGDGKAKLLRKIESPDDFLTFPHFKISEKNKVAGATYWDGNVDIIKMNLSNPVNTPRNRQGCLDARNYLLGVADYWTETVQSHLILETAKAGDKAAIAKANGIDDKLFGRINGSVEGGTFVSRVLKQGKEVATDDIIKNFPLQTLETSEELSAIFAQPKFGKKLLDNDTLSAIRTQFDSVVGVLSQGKGNEYQAYIKKVYGNEILRYIFASAMNKNAVENGKVNLSELKKVTLKSIDKGKSASAEDEVNAVVKNIKNGLKEVNTGGLKTRLQKETKNISLEDFKLAEAIVLQGKGGLNWRFDAAKDIGDLDAVRAGKKTFNQIWNGDSRNPGVQQFWGDFVSRIRRYNPAAYVINEVTSLGEFVKNYDNDVDRTNFDPQLARYYNEAPVKTGDKKPIHEYHPIYTKQVQFLDETNSTTTSEYSKGFNAFSKFAGVDPEGKGEGVMKTITVGQHADVRKKAGDLQEIRNIMEDLMEYNQPNSAIYSHMFVSNHDKPSVLHTMPLNMSVYIADDLEKAVKSLEADEKALADTLLGSNPNYKQVCSKALGVGMAMLKTIEGSKDYTKEEKKKLQETLKMLVHGQKEVGGAPSFKRAEAFGVKPYEATIKDLLERSGVAKKLEKETLDFHSSMMKDSMTYYSRLWQVMNASVGTPTIYGGHEFAQTGYETPSKNVYLGIRNEVLHGLKDDPRYQGYYETMQKTSGLYQQEGLSALRNGTPTSLDILKDNKTQIWPIYRKDSKGSEVISIVTNLGLPNGVASYEAPATDIKPHTCKGGIKLAKDKKALPLTNGTIFKRVGDNAEYIVNDGILKPLKGGTDVILRDTVTHFYKAAKAVL